MKVKLSKDMAIAADGFTVKEGKEGDVVDIDDVGGKALVARGEAELADDNTDASEQLEDKDAGRSRRKTK